MSHQIPDEVYLKYLLLSLNMDELKEICRAFKIKGFSKFGKEDLTNFLIDSLAEEEVAELLKEREMNIISREINRAFNIIRGDERESVQNIKIINPKEHEIEIKFKGFRWTNELYLSIKDTNIFDPERICECRIGSAGGFCPHFWVGFMVSLKKGFFDLKNWTTTKLPKDFGKRIKDIQISTISKDKSIEQLRIFDVTSDDVRLLKFLNSRTTVYDGTVTDLEFKEDDFQGNITRYYIATLKNGKLGPQIKKKSDFNENELEEFEEIKARISEKKHIDADLKVQDIISLNGSLTKDNFLDALVLKRVTKIQKK